MSKSIPIAVVGSGYVGLVAAVCFAEIGHDVICVDNDERKVAALESGDTLIHEKLSAGAAGAISQHEDPVHDGSGRGDAGVRGDLYRGGNAAVGDGRRGPLLRGGGGLRDCAFAHQLQGDRREVDGAGLHERVDSAGDGAQRRGATAVRRGLESGVSARGHRGGGFSASRPDCGWCGQ